MLGKGLSIQPRPLPPSKKVKKVIKFIIESIIKLKGYPAYTKEVDRSYQISACLCGAVWRKIGPCADPIFSTRIHTNTRILHRSARECMKYLRYFQCTLVHVCGRTVLPPTFVPLFGIR